jgi:hypothetical protein
MRLRPYNEANDFQASAAHSDRETATCNLIEQPAYCVQQEIKHIWVVDSVCCSTTGVVTLTFWYVQFDLLVIRLFHNVTL